MRNGKMYNSRRTMSIFVGGIVQIDPFIKRKAQRVVVREKIQVRDLEVRGRRVS